MRYLNIAFYRFVELRELPELRASLKDKCKTLGVRGTIILSPEGINGFIAGPEEEVRGLQGFLESLPSLQALDYKESFSPDIPFGKLMIKLKREIIPMGRPDIKPSELTAERCTARQLKEWLDAGREVCLVDTRNEYEIAAGTFRGAVNLGLKTFKEFSERFEEKMERIPPGSKDRPIVMFCTGGIRCEKATALALQKGLENVYQLDGGILKYFEQVGSDHYDGSCFVFDEREALSQKGEPTAP